MKWIAKTCMACFTFSSCLNPERFSNDYKGGNFTVDFYACGHDELLDGQEQLVERHEQRIAIMRKGHCLDDCYDYTFKGDVVFEKDSVYLYMTETRKLKDEYKGRKIKTEDCLCPNEMVYLFEKPIPATMPYKVVYKLEAE